MKQMLENIYLSSLCWGQLQIGDSGTWVVTEMTKNLHYPLDLYVGVKGAFTVSCPYRRTSGV